MTACKDSRGIAPGKRALGATLAGALAAGMVPAAALAAEQPEADGIEALSISGAEAFKAGTVTEAKDAQGNVLTGDALKNIEFTANGKAQYVTPTKVTLKDGTVVDVTDEKSFDVTYDANSAGTFATSADDIKSVGSYTVKVAAKADTPYYNSGSNGELTIGFSIVGASLKGSVAIDGDDAADTAFTYNAGEQEVGFALNGKVLEENTNYTVKYYKAGVSQIAANEVTPEAAGNYVAVLTGADTYAGSTTQVPFTVDTLDLQKANVVIADTKVDDKVAVTSINGDTTPALLGKVSAAFKSGTNAKGETVYGYGDNGSYVFTVAAATDADKANIVNSADVSFDKVANTATFEYDGAAFTALEVDHSKGYADFDASKITVKDGSGTALKADQYTVTYADKDGNAATVADVKKAGEWVVTVKVNAAATDYALGGTATMTVKVTEGELVANQLYVTYKGTVAKKIEATYDGKNVADDVKATLFDAKGNKVDCKLTYTGANGKEVKEVVDAGTYKLTVTAPGYTFDDTTTNEIDITVSAIEVKKVQVTGLTTVQVEDTTDPQNPQEKPFSFLPYTGEAIVPVVEYTTVDNPTDKDWVALPADVYTATYKWGAKEGDTKKGVKEVKDLGFYEMAFATPEGAVENYDFDTNTVKAEFQVSDKKLFADVAVTDWFYADVYNASSLNYLNGYNGTKFFGPNNQLTRAEAVQVLYNMAGGKYTGVIDPDEVFGDVEAIPEWSTAAIQWAKSLGIVTGYGDTNEFRPNQSVTREEFATMLARYADVKGDYEAGDGSALAGMSDAASVSGWAAEAVDWAVEGEYMGSNGWVAPQTSITRAEVAKMVVAYQPEKLTL